MSYQTGFASLLALQKDEEQSTYGAAETLGANDQIPFISFTPSADRTIFVPRPMDGNLGSQLSYQTKSAFGGNLVVPMLYSGGIEDLICFALGYENPNDDDQEGSPHQYTSGVEKHIFEVDHHLHRIGWGVDGDRLTSGAGGGTWVAADQKVRSFTLGLDAGVEDWRFIATMINSLKFSGDQEKCEMSLDLISYDRNEGDYGSSSWSLRSELLSGYSGLIVKPTHVSFEIGVDGGDSVNIYPSTWELVINNNLAADHRTVNDKRILEPVRNNFVEVTFKFELPRYTEDTYLTYKSSNYGYVSIEFLGGLITGSYYYRLGLFLPYVEFIDTVEPHIDGPGTSSLVIAGKSSKSYSSLPSPTSGPWATTTARLEDVTLQKNGPLIALVQNANANNILTLY